MARAAAANAAPSANTSKKRKDVSAGDDEIPMKRARTTATASTTKQVAAAPKTKAAASKAKATTTTKKGPTTKKTNAAAKSAVPTKKATATATKKKAPITKTKTPEPKINGKSKRKLETETDGEELTEVETTGAKVGEVPEEKPKPVKRARISKESPKPKALKPRKKGDIINTRPTSPLNVFVFGENSTGELGLGATGQVNDVTRPRLNPFLKDENVVAVAAGGMHVVYLTANGRILTCGGNDEAALGRQTAGQESDSDTGLVPAEATPMEVDMSDVPEGTVFTAVAAGDSTTFALTDEGLVYGCGTFRGNEGTLGFTGQVSIQRTLTQVQGIKNIVKMTCGANHVLALDKKGNAWAWGAGQQNQLGRRVVERTKIHGLTPREIGLPRNKVVGLWCGAYHSFALDKAGKVYAWGLNSFGETGIPENAGKDEAVILKPTVVKQLSGRGITHMACGSHHSLAVTEAGECLVFGRVDGYQMGLKISDMKDEDVIRDERGNVRILKTATPLPNIGYAVYPASGSDHSFVINKDGKCFAWGFSVNYQTGLGTEDDVEEATMIDNKATRDEKLVWAGAGGQYGVLAGVKKSE